MLSKTGALQVSRPNPEDVARNLAWENGSVSLAGDTLQAAANEFNRYNQKKIVVDPALAHETVVGWFEAKDPAGFARAAAVSFNGEVLIEGQTIRIRPKK
jgi:transmembrane sensor